MPLCSPPMIPASPSGFFSSATSSRSASRSSAWPLSSVSLFTVAREAHDDVAFEQRVVVGMQRLAEFEHHVVGDVDDRGDRADAAALEALLHPRRRRRARVDALDDAGAKARARERVLDADAAASSAAARRRCERRRRDRTPVIAPTSRAMPRIDRQSARFGVSFSVSSESSRSSAGAGRRRSAQSGSSSSSPDASSEMPSSAAEHSMPCDSTPRIAALRIVQASRQLGADERARHERRRARHWARRRRSTAARPGRRRRCRRSGVRRSDGARRRAPCRRRLR